MKRTSKRTSASRRSSPSPRARGPAAELLAAFTGVARRLRLRWYVFGAQAVGVYAIPRTTADVDVTVDLADHLRPSFVAAMTRAGFQLRVDDDAFVRQTRVLPFVHLPSGWPLDVVLAGPGLEAEFLGRVRREKVAGVTVPVIAPADLMALKVLAGRPHDLEDVRNLLRHTTPRDVRATRALLGLLEAATDRADLLPVLDALAAPPKERR